MCWNQITKTELKTWFMIYDHALTNQNSSWIRNVTCLSAISQALLMDCCAGPTKGEKLKRMTLTSTQHTGAIISFYKDWLWDAFKLLIAFFPLKRRPPFPPPSPHNTPGNLCLNPPPLLSPPAQPPFYKPHTTHIPLIAPTKGLTHETSALETLYGGQFTLSTQLMKPNYHCLTEQQ